VRANDRGQFAYIDRIGKDIRVASRHVVEPLARAMILAILWCVLFAKRTTCLSRLMATTLVLAVELFGMRYRWKRLPADTSRPG
jgi:predicted metal-dependent phosphotriesterase family hydrolase